MRKFITMLFLFSMCSLAQAKIIFTGKDRVSVKTDIPSWVKQIKHTAQNEISTYQNDADGYTECRETLELANVYLCGSYLERDMNAMLARATIYSDGVREYSKGSLVPLNNKRLRSLMDIITGHDLPGKELLAFYRAAHAKCVAGKYAFCLSNAENNFFDRVVLPINRNNKPFVIIAFSVQTTSVPMYTVSHEFLHARFFMDPQYQQHIQSFWESNLTAAERNVIEAELKLYGYNNRDKATIMNEFQAYILQDGAENSRLSQFVGKYRPSLISMCD